MVIQVCPKNFLDKNNDKNFEQESPNGKFNITLSIRTMEVLKMLGHR